MAKHLHREIEKLKRDILGLGTLVEETVLNAVSAVEERDENIATSVINGDTEIDRMEVELEEECLKILALHQPVARDLRFIVAVLKINNDLERIADLAVNISERVCHLATHDKIEVPPGIFEMAEISRSMLRDSLDSLVNQSTRVAHNVCILDERVDGMHKQMYETVRGMIEQDTEHLDQYLHIVSISRYLERIADLATNIAEDVIYMYAGEIVRHKVEDFSPRE